MTSKNKTVEDSEYNDDVIKKLKNNKDIKKFMIKYRYMYHRTMVEDLAKLVYNSYLEGYNNGLGQHKIELPVDSVEV